ncbi:MAG: TRAP transporter small permease [Alphaproteobacteria bacterium]|nr:TRAP transporter small permease [Alphaproteobacteria bacterium]
MKAIERALDLATDALVGLGFLLMLAMALHVVADVAAKYLFALPVFGTGEIVSYYYMVGLIFLPLAFVQRKKAHIMAELLTKGWGTRPTAWLDLGYNTLMALFVALLVWRSAAEAIRATGVGEHVQGSGYFIYVWPARWMLPAGLGVMALYALLQAARNAASLARR